MKREYDFSQGIRGKFFRPNTTIKLPVYLEPGVEAYLNDLAKKKRQTVSALVNRLLKKEIDLLKTIL